MTTEIKAPQLPESVPDGTIATWYKNVGEKVSRDDLLVDIETDKVVIEVVAPDDGVLAEILKVSGETITSNEAIAKFEAGTAVEVSASPSAQVDVVSNETVSASTAVEGAGLSPAARKLIEENSLVVNEISGTGKDGRITKEDVINHLSAQSSTTHKSSEGEPAQEISISPEGRIEERVPMSRLRAKVAERLLTATQTTAMLTTFNEVNMQPVMDIRAKYKDEFEKAHERGAARIYVVFRAGFH